MYSYILYLCSCYSKHLLLTCNIASDFVILILASHTLLTFLLQKKDFIFKILLVWRGLWIRKKAGQFSFAGNFNKAVNLVRCKAKIINILSCLYCYLPSIIIKEKEKHSRMTAIHNLSTRETDTKELPTCTRPTWVM